MLLSVTHRFIFIKTKKTAGTSLQTVLAKHLRGHHDIITPIFEEGNENYQPWKKEAKYYPGKNYANPGADRNTKHITEARFWGHMPASEIKQKLPPEVWDGYTKITSERHPYEKAVSLAWFHFPLQDRYSTFSALLEHVVDTGDYANWFRYSIDNRNVVDIVIRYEHLLQDTNATLERLGLPQVKSLPRFKAQYRKDARPAMDILSVTQKKRIQEFCAREFEHFGYAY